MKPILQIFVLTATLTLGFTSTLNAADCLDGGVLFKGTHSPWPKDSSLLISARGQDLSVRLSGKPVFKLFRDRSQKGDWCWQSGNALKGKAQCTPRLQEFYLERKDKTITVDTKSTTPPKEAFAHMTLFVDGTGVLSPCGPHAGADLVFASTFTSSNPTLARMRIEAQIKNKPVGSLQIEETLVPQNVNAAGLKTFDVELTPGKPLRKTGFCSQPVISK